MNQSTRSSKLALMAFLVVGILAAPLGAAQEAPELSATISKANLIKPEVGSESIDVDFTYTLNNAGYNLAGTYKSTTAITVGHDCPPGVNVEGPAKVVLVVDQENTQGGSSTHDAQAEYFISATREAKGLTQLRCTLTARAAALQDSTVPQSNELNQDYFVTVGYYDSLSINIPTPIQRAAPQREIAFTMSITNFGNADTRLLFGYAEEGVPNNPKYDWNAVLPTAQIVPTGIGGGNNVLDVTFTVSTPARTGWNNILDGYTLEIRPQAEIDSSALGTPVTASVLIRVRGVYVPGFEALGLIGGLLGALLVVRRRQLE